MWCDEENNLLSSVLCADNDSDLNTIWVATGNKEDPS